MSDLTEYNLIGTGPMEAYDNPPGSLVTIICLYSKNEYSYLTEKGYKEAVKIATISPPAPRPPSANIHITESTFHNSPIGVGGGEVAQTVISSTASLGESFSAIRSEVTKQVQDQQERETILAKLNELEVDRDKPSRIGTYTKLIGLASKYSELIPLVESLFHKVMG